jgi:hypothetical protein
MENGEWGLFDAINLLFVFTTSSAESDRFSAVPSAKRHWLAGNANVAL